MQFFEKDGEVYKSVPAGGTGGGVTGSVPVKASEAEAVAFRAAPAPDHEPAAPEAPADPVASLEPAVETEDPSKLTADATT